MYLAIGGKFQHILYTNNMGETTREPSPVIPGQGREKIEIPAVSSGNFIIGTTMVSRQSMLSSCLCSALPFQIVAKFGMMHIIATNACIVIRTLVKESSKEMMGHHEENEHSISTNISIQHVRPPAIFVYTL